MGGFLGKYFKGDKVVWTVVIILSLISLLAVYSSTGTLAYKYQGGNTAYYFLKHGLFILIGFAIIYITHSIPYRYYSKISQLLLYIAIPLLALTLILGTSLNEASRWLTLPGLGITFQTSDLAKLALFMFIARMLAKRQDVIKDFKQGFRPVIIPVFIVCLLILPANFSTSALVFATSWIVMFVGRINLKYLFGLLGAGLLMIILVFILSSYLPDVGRLGTWKNRVERFVAGDASDDYQVEQAKIAIVTGGWTGKKPGNSTQRNFLPHPYSDFIFAIIVEEYGLIGGFIILFLYLILLYRAGLIARKSPGDFGAFLAFGLGFSLVFQAFINIAVAVNLLPVTGQPLPFVSMGGTSMLFASAAIGIILSVSVSSTITKNETQNEPATA